MDTADYLVVGSGLTGSTIARLLADDKREVLILERRNHRGGNVHDSVHESGIRIHSYGPHYFRCSSPRIWQFVNRFSSFYHYKATVKARVRGQYHNWPLNQSVVDKVAGRLDSRATGIPSNFEEACLQKMPRELYEIFVKNYTRRQWGMDPHKLQRSLADRIRINSIKHESLTPTSAYQGLPTDGYAQMMSNMVAGITCVLGVDYLKNAHRYKARKALIFTGSIDEFFNFDAGALGYRSQKRIHKFLPSLDWKFPCGQVNHPDVDEKGPVRSLEWKHLMPLDQQGGIKGTVITREYPFTPHLPDQFEYPMPLEGNRQLYEHYRKRARAIPGLVVCGRLGAYRYFDMDHAIGHAMTIAKIILSNNRNGEVLSGIQ